MATVDPRTVARNARWLAHRYDPQHDAVHFVDVPRAEHGAAMFLTDEYLARHAEPVVIGRDHALGEARAAAPIHFIFHSAYCCSTLLARAFDRPGRAMGLKEPMILNDLVGWRRRGARPAEVARVLDGAMALLARPFAPGEAVVVKPSNIVNGLAAAMLGMRPQAGALLLHAPLRTYLGSIARKGMWGRLWVRELLVGLLADGGVQLGFAAGDYVGQTDLQVAAVGWLAQHAGFAALAERFGPGRVRTLDSETLTARPAETMAALARLFRIDLDAAAVAEIVAGPAFTRHSKWGTDFGGAARAAEQRDAAAVHAEEIDKVAVWAEAVAAGAGVSPLLGSPLLAGDKNDGGTDG